MVSAFGVAFLSVGFLPLGTFFLICFGGTLCGIECCVHRDFSLVCVRKDGMYLGREALDWMCRSIRKHLKGFENFHFHSLRHTYTSNLLANGAPPKDVQELLGHSAVSSTMNIYAHATREAKKNSARLLDKVVGND